MKRANATTPTSVQPLDGAVEGLQRLRAAGLALACVSDWDFGLREQLEKVGLSHHFDLVLTSAEAGAIWLSGRPAFGLNASALPRQV